MLNNLLPKTRLEEGCYTLTTIKPTNYAWEENE